VRAWKSVEGKGERKDAEPRQRKPGKRRMKDQESFAMGGQFPQQKKGKEEILCYVEEGKGKNIGRVDRQV